VDQPTREQLLHTEAAKYGIAPDVIDRAVGIITAVQRRDRADFRRNFGGELTPDRWLAAYGVSGFEELCSYAVRKAGLGDDGGEVIRRIVSAVASPPEQRADDRPVHFWAVPSPTPRRRRSPPTASPTRTHRMAVAPASTGPAHCCAAPCTRPPSAVRAPRASRRPRESSRSPNGTCPARTSPGPPRGAYSPPVPAAASGRGSTRCTNASAPARSSSPRPLT
jgi:hypothetical protein